jgi:hypothetical protein
MSRRPQKAMILDEDDEKLPETTNKEPKDDEQRLPKVRKSKIGTPLSFSAYSQV